MAGTCVVCGRNLKTGRKYCYQHRHSHEQNYSSTKMGDAEAHYLKLRFKYQRYAVYFLSFVFLILALNSGYNYNLDSSFWFGLIWLVLLIFAIGGFTTLAEREIKKRSPVFVRFAKSYSEYLQNKKDFRKSIFGSN